MGYEIYCNPEYLLKLALAIEEIGKEYNYKWYGARALMSMRLEKGWGVWSLDYRPDFNAIESGLEKFINWDKEFVGKDATLKLKNSPNQKKLVTLEIKTEGIDVSNDEAIIKNGKTIGYISSGGYGHHVKKSLAMGYIDVNFISPNSSMEVEILGKFYKAKVLGKPLYDEAGLKMRA